MTDQPVVRTTLMDQALPDGVAITHVETRRITIAPSVAGGAHVHNGPVFGVIENGSAVLQVEDGPEVVLRAGDAFYEPANVVISRFDATGEGVTFVAHFLLGAGETPTIDFVGGSPA
ncbi:MAG: cupin 2 protein [Glaciihabitans sp.]|nr:cupin 2 protein [Glaciihabitans sp.]